MLTRNQKKELVVELSEKLSKSKGAVFCDFKGLTVAEISQLRASLRQSGAAIRVAKKTLLTLALKDAQADIDAKAMEGQVAVIYSAEDEVVSSKITHEFARKHEALKIIKGMLDKKEISKEQVVALAKLPGKQEMLAMLVGTIQAPVSGFVNVLGGNLRKFVYALNAIKEAKG